MTKQILQNDWQALLNEEFTKDYYLKLRAFLINEYKTETIYPAMENIFNALHLTPYSKVKVVILGQDPYHGPQQAHGLSFSVQDNIAIPPSLRNIFKELADDLQIPIPTNGNLTKWAEQGVLLLNNVLTVRAGKAHSHQGAGWEKFTDKVITLLNNSSHSIVYILWGKAAQAKIPLIDRDKHHIIQSVHPSPLSAHRGFFGSKPFSKTNTFLLKNKLAPIDWSLN